MNYAKPHADVLSWDRYPAVFNSFATVSRSQRPLVLRFSGSFTTKSAMAGRNMTHSCKYGIELWKQYPAYDPGHMFGVGYMLLSLVWIVKLGKEYAMVNVKKDFEMMSDHRAFIPYRIKPVKYVEVSGIAKILSGTMFVFIADGCPAFTPFLCQPGAKNDWMHVFRFTNYAISGVVDVLCLSQFIRRRLPYRIDKIVFGFAFALGGFMLIHSKSLGHFGGLNIKTHFHFFYAYCMFPLGFLALVEVFLSNRTPARHLFMATWIRSFLMMLAGTWFSHLDAAVTLVELPATKREYEKYRPKVLRTLTNYFMVHFCVCFILTLLVQLLATQYFSRKMVREEEEVPVDFNENEILEHVPSIEQFSIE